MPCLVLNAAARVHNCIQMSCLITVCTVSVLLLQETCVKAEELVGKAGGLGGGPAGGGVSWGGRLEGVDLMVRAAKSYCAAL